MSLEMVVPLTMSDLPVELVQELLLCMWAVPALARAALAAGADGVFLETHPNPDQAISDAASQIPLEALPELVASLLKVWRAVRYTNMK